MGGWMRRAIGPGLATLALVGCAPGAEDVNRVQPNYYRKSLFEGDWYYRQTVIEVPYEAGYLFEGIASDLELIHWEVQEEALIAYRRNELVPGANGELDEPPRRTPVAAWRIVSHFDIRREYNPATGEQTNVIVENTTDRPWYEREFIRVDWSKNLVPNQNSLEQFLGFTATGEAVPYKMTGADYWVQGHEEEDPDRFEIGPGYISVVGRYHVEPDVVTCYLALNDLWGTGSGSNCGPATIRIRSSFLRRDPDRPRYEPLRFDDRLPLVPSVDRNGDGVVDNRDRVARKLTICADGRIDGNTFSCEAVTEVACTPEALTALARDPIHRLFRFTEDDCVDASVDQFGRFGYFRTERLTWDRQYGHTESGRINLANRWNIWEESYGPDGSPLPYAERKVKPIVFHLNPGFPEDLLPAAQEVASQWNEALRQTVAALQGKPIEEVPDVFVVRPNDCSPSQVRAWVEANPRAEKVVERTIGGLDRLGPGNLERLCAALEWHLDFTWQKPGDLRHSFLSWVNRPQLAGPLGYGPSYADPETGELVSANAWVYGAAVDASAAFATDIVQVMRGEIPVSDIADGEAIRRIVLENRKRGAEERRREWPESFFAEMDWRLSRWDALPPDQRLVTIPPNHYEARLALLDDSPLLREHFYNEALLAAFVPNYRPGESVSDEDLRRIAPSKLFGRSARDARNRRLLALTSKHCTLLQEFTDPSIVGLALEYEAGNKSREEIYRDLRHRIFVAVMLHEVGHTLGLRHNFGGSSDALNYFDDFWRLLELDPDPNVALGQVSDDEERRRLQSCIDTADRVGQPTPTTLECLRGSELRQASIMDYGARFNSDFMGIGKYDRAAIAFGYGGLLEVFDDGVPVPPDFEARLVLDDYRKIPALLGGREKIAARRFVSFDAYRRALADALLARAQALPRFGPGGRCVENCADDLPRPVPYRFCSDEFADYSLHCKRWDEGASQTEIVRSAIDQFRNYYPFHAFKRDRFNWSPASYLDRIDSRIFQHFTIAYQYYYFFGELYRNRDIGRDLLVASTEGLNLLAEVLQTPEPGHYAYCPTAGMYLPTARYDCEWDPAQGEVVIPLGVGKPYWNDFTDDYYYTWSRIGSYYEKVWALYALTDSQARFYRVDTDSSNYSINFWRSFKPEMLRLLGGIIANDLPSVGGRVVRRSLRSEFAFAPLVDPEAIGGGQPLVEGVPLLPRISWDVRWTAALLGMAWLSSTLDTTQDFRNYFKVSIKGAQDDVEYPDNLVSDPERYVEVTDPSSLFTYRAAQTTDGESYAFRMVRDTRVFKEQVWQVARDAYLAAEPGTEAFRQARATWEVAEAELAWRFEFLRSLRLLQNAFEFAR